MSVSVHLFFYRQMHSRSPFRWNSIPTMRNTSSIPWTFVHWKRLASIEKPIVKMIRDPPSLPVPHLELDGSVPFLFGWKNSHSRNFCNIFPRIAVGVEIHCLAPNSIILLLVILAFYMRKSQLLRISDLVDLSLTLLFLLEVLIRAAGRKKRKLSVWETFMLAVNKWLLRS